MNTILHLVRKDFLARRGVILVWLLLLALGLLLDLGWVGAASAEPDSYGLGAALFGLLGTLAGIMVCVVVVPAVREDTPAIRERFLATRPVSPRALWMGKALFLLLAIVVPFLLRTVLCLVLSGQGLRVVLLGTLEVALWAVPVVVVIAAFVSLWATWTRCFIAGLLLVGVGWGVLALIDGFTTEVSIERRILAGPVALVTGLLVAAAGFLLFTISRRALLLGMRAKLAAAFVVFAVAVLAFLFGPTRLGEVQGTGPVAGLPASGEIDPLEATSRYHWYMTPKGTRLSVSVQPPRPVELAPDHEIVWGIPSTICNGRTYTGRQVGPVALIEQSMMNRSLRLPLVTAVESHLGGEVNWTLSDHGFGLGALSPPHSSPVPVDENSEEPQRFSVEMAGAVYQWELVADLPLVAGSSATVGPETWEVLKAGASEVGSFHASFRGSRPELWLSNRWEDRLGVAARHRPDVAVVFYDPARQAAYMDRGDSVLARRTAGSGYVRRSYSFACDQAHHRHGGGFFKGTADGLRLLLLRPRYLTTIARNWKTPKGVRPASIPFYRGGGLARRDKNLTNGKFARWFDALEKPSPDEPVARVAPFLVEVLEKSAYCGSYREVDEPVVRELAAYVPAHLDLFLRARRALAQNDHVTEDLIKDVLIQGVEEAQAGKLVAHLRRDLGLLEVLEKRGWCAQAVPHLRELMEAGRDDSRLIRVLARHGALDDYLPRLLRRLERDADTTLYTQLRAVPGIDDRLDGAVQKMWEAHGRLLMPDPLKSRHLRVALQHGLPEAVEVFHRLVAEEGDRGRGEWHYASDILGQSFSLEELKQGDRHRDGIVVPWFLERKPEDFRFDPVSRVFAHVPPSF